jgi:CubicO group peptidase (beta-lactamase class C family)
MSRLFSVIDAVRSSAAPSVVLSQKITKANRVSKLLSGFACLLAITNCSAKSIDQPKIKDTVDKAIAPLMQAYNIPGVAVAVTVNGKHYFYNYGITSKKDRQPITNQTLFEIGSISKTFTATMASYAQLNGKLSLSDRVSKYLPDLKGSSFDNVQLLNLGTHTAGGLPLQVPDEIKNNDQLMDYYKNWKPTYAPSTSRVYSNPSIGMLGMIAAKSLNMPFDDAMEQKLFPALGLTHSYINVPAEQMTHYAQGYNKQDEPVRVNPGVLASEAYGIKSNALDMIRFIDQNMLESKLDAQWQRAVTNTHTGYFKVGELTQDLIWEQYSYPVTLDKILAGNSNMMITEATAATPLNPSLAPQTDVWINKTGSTNGFASYVAFIPAKKIGIVIMTNKNHPINPRITAAYQILTELDRQTTVVKP